MFVNQDAEAKYIGFLLERKITKESRNYRMEGIYILPSNFLVIFPSINATERILLLWITKNTEEHGSDRLLFPRILSIYLVSLSFTWWSVFSPFRNTWLEPLSLFLPGWIDIRARMRGFELRPLLSRDYRRKRGTTESISLTQTFRDRRRRRRRRRQSVAHPTTPSFPSSSSFSPSIPSSRRTSFDASASNSRTNHWTPNCPSPLWNLHRSLTRRDKPGNNLNDRGEKLGDDWKRRWWDVIEKEKPNLSRSINFREIEKRWKNIWIESNLSR